MVLCDKMAVLQVLGCLLRKPVLMADREYKLTADDFPEQFHKIVFGAIEHLGNDGAEHIDAIDVDQFLSPYTNHRKDEYGGSLENRMRFMKMCLDEVMTAAGNDMAVLVKTNMSDGFRGGLETDDCIEVARNIEQCGVHALVLSGGFVSKAPMYVMRGRMPIRSMTYYMKQLWLKWGVRMAGRWMIHDEPFREAYFYEDALKFRKALKLPLVYVGGLVSREKIDMVLDSGFECVAMARALINEPDFVNRMKNEGEMRCGCDHVNYCIARMYSIEMACHKHMQNLPNCIQKEIKRELERR